MVEGCSTSSKIEFSFPSAVDGSSPLPEGLAIGNVSIKLSGVAITHIAGLIYCSILISYLFYNFLSIMNIHALNVGRRIHFAA